MQLKKKSSFAKDILKKLNVENVINISSVSGENITYLIRELQNFIVKMKNKENIKIKEKNYILVSIKIKNEKRKFNKRLKKNCN